MSGSAQSDIFSRRSTSWTDVPGREGRSFGADRRAALCRIGIYTTNDATTNREAMSTTTSAKVSTVSTENEIKRVAGGGPHTRIKPTPATREVRAQHHRRVLPLNSFPVGAQVKLSILMPAFNEERTIAQAVNEVLASEYPWPFELIVVDDGSRDRTLEIVESIEHPRLLVVRHLGIWARAQPFSLVPRSQRERTWCRSMPISSMPLPI